MNSRELSEKLDGLAGQIEAMVSEHSIIGEQLPGTRDEFLRVAAELRNLSNEKYSPAPGSTASWSDIKPKSSAKQFTNRDGKPTPF